MKLYIKQKCFSRGDTYKIDIADGEDEGAALCVALVIDAVIAQNNTAAPSAAASNNG